MTDDKLKNLLKEFDRNAIQPCPVEVDISTIRKRAQRRKISRIVYQVAAAAIVILAVGILCLSGKKTETGKEKIQIASIDTAMKIRQIMASTDEAINLIQEIRENEERQRRLNKLEAELAAIPDPLEEIQQELDRTAFILVFSADKMYKELNLTDSAVETYKRVIKLFPDNQWAQVARERLEDIKNRQNNDRSQGESKWKLQNTLS